MTITEFLEARIAEDEADAINRVVLRSEDRRSLTMDDAERAQAECAAKRAIIARHYRPSTPNPYELALRNVMRDLAAVYADHPDYQQEWAL